MENISENITLINWGVDNTDMIRAKQRLDDFLQEQIEFKGKSTPKIDAYHQRVIKELTDYILSNK